MEFWYKSARNSRGQGGEENKIVGPGKDAVGISLGKVGKGRWHTDCQTEAQGIVADKVGSGGSSVRQDAEGTAAGPRGREGQGSFSLHLQSPSNLERTCLSPVTHPWA